MHWLTPLVLTWAERLNQSRRHDKVELICLSFRAQFSENNVDVE